jgi:hypothetical protein
MGNPGGAGRAYTAGAAIHLDAHRGDKLWLHSSWGYETPVAHFDEKEKDFNFAVAGMYEMREKLHSVIELFGQHDFNGHLTQMSVAPEMIYSLALGTESSGPDWSNFSHPQGRHPSSSDLDNWAVRAPVSSGFQSNLLKTGTRLYCVR